MAMPFKLLKDFWIQSNKNIQREDIICGFVDNWGDFHTRAEAWIIGDAADQILFGRGTQDPKETPILISEHLYLDKEE